MSFSTTSRLASRTFTRAAPIARSTARQTVRFNSAQAGAEKKGSSAVVGGLVGGAIVGAGLYGYYHFSGAKDVVNTAVSAKKSLSEGADAFKKNLPEPNEALDFIKSKAKTYAVFIPGGTAFVESTFKDIDSIRSKHSKEVDAILQETYKELEKVSKDKGLSLEAATEGWAVITKQLTKITDLAGDVFEQIIENHPELKEKVGGNIAQLKELGDKYGGDAKKQLEDTWKQVSDVVKNGKGVSKENLDALKKIFEEAQEKLQKFGDEAYKKGLEQAKPYLEKAGKEGQKIQKLLDDKSGELLKNVSKIDLNELFEKVQESAKAKDSKPVEEYLKKILSTK